MRNLARRRKSRNTLIIVLMLGIVLFFIFGMPRFSLSMSTLPVGSGVWGFGFDINTLSIDGNSKAVEGLNVGWDYDGFPELQDDPNTLHPYYIQLVGAAPEVFVGGSHLRFEGAMAPMGEYYIYKYAFDLVITTHQKKVAPITIFSECKPIQVGVDMEIFLTHSQITGDIPNAYISNWVIATFETGVQELYGLTWAEIQPIWESGADPSLNINPQTVTHQQAGTTLMTSNDVSQASAHLSCGIQVGVVYEWGTDILGRPEAQDCFAYNQYVKYGMEVEVAVHQSDTPPAVSPFQWFIDILENFGGKARDIFDLGGGYWQQFGFWIVILIFGLGSILILVRYGKLGRRKSSGGRKNASQGRLRSVRKVVKVEGRDRSVEFVERNREPRRRRDGR